MKEIWKDIDGLFGYQVSNLGRVRSFFSRWGKRKYPKIMKGSIDSHGIPLLLLKKDDFLMEKKTVLPIYAWWERRKKDG